MLNIAQTNLQLYAQLEKAEWEEVDVLRVRDAWELAAQVFGCRQRPNGKPFLCHLAGVASLLAHSKVNMDLVLAGLLHSAYTHADFGDIADRGVRRRIVEKVIGPNAESIVHRYSTWNWNSEKVDSLLAHGCSPSEIDLLQIRLADMIDDCLDQGLNRIRPGGTGPAEMLKDSFKTLPALSEAVGMFLFRDLLDQGISDWEMNPRRRAQHQPRPPVVKHRPKICLFRSVGRGSGGGTAIYMANLAAGLLRSGFDVQVVLASNYPSETTRIFHLRGIPVVCIEAIHEFSWFRRTLHLSRALRRSKPDLIIFHHGDYKLHLVHALVALLLRTRCLMIAHLTVLPRSRVERFKQKAAALLSTGIISPHQISYEIYKGLGIPERRIHLIRTGLPISNRIPQREARRQLGFAYDEPIVGFVGRLEAVKEIDLLIRSVSQIIMPDSSAILVIAGEGSEEENLLRAAKHYLGERCYFLGHTEDPSVVYAAIDVLAITSVEEGLPNVILEAAFQQTPAVSVNTGGIGDFVINEKTGLLVDSRSPKAIAAALERVLCDDELRTRLGKGAEERALRYHTPERFDKEYSRLIQSLVTA